MAYNEDPIMNQNKGYAKQEKYNLTHDNPVAKHASWMSKHCCDMSRLSPIKHCGPAHK